MSNRKTKQLSFDEALQALRAAGFDVTGTSASTRITKYGCAAVVKPLDGDLNPGTSSMVFIERPGFVLGGEIATLLDRGFQKFLKTAKIETTATADHLRAIHKFSEELREIGGAISLYNESLGTTSDQYMYDRVKGRDLPQDERKPHPWQLN